MIKEFSAKSKPSNNKARVLFVVCMSASFALIMLSTFLSLYRGVFSLLGVGFFAVALVLYAKYVSPIYYYDITFDSENTPIFVVRQQVGKKFSTLCRIDLADIIKIDKQTSKERREHKTPMGTVRYSYLPTLDPAVAYRITVRSRYEKAEILIESSEEFARLLMSYSGQAKDMRTDSDEY